MKAWLRCLPAVLCCTQLLAQTTPSATPAPVDPAEYQRIEATRTQETATFDAQEAECYKHFAVSGCVKDVEVARRGMLARLRREEALLHEQEAAFKGAEQKRAMEQKKLDKQQQEKEAAANKADAANRLQAQKDKQAAHAAQSPSSAPVKADGPSGPSAAEQASNRASYERKQQDAEKKRQEIAKRLADKQGKSAKPLPVPP